MRSYPSSLFLKVWPCVFRYIRMISSYIQHISTKGCSLKRSCRIHSTEQYRDYSLWGLVWSACHTPSLFPSLEQWISDWERPRLSRGLAGPRAGITTPKEDKLVKLALNLRRHYLYGFVYNWVRSPLVQLLSGGTSHGGLPISGSLTLLMAWSVV